MHTPVDLCAPYFVLQGKYHFKLLAVDIRPDGSILPMFGDEGKQPPLQVQVQPAGQQQRIYVEGDSAAYDRGGILTELRDPFLRVSTMCDYLL